MQFSSRIAKIQAVLRRKKLDAFLVSQPQNRRYLCGYTAPDHGIEETSGLLLILRNRTTYLLTDFRFKEQAEREAEGCEVLLYPNGVFVLLEKLLADLGIKNLGFESDYTLHSTAAKYFSLGQDLSINMVPTQGIVEKLRVIKSEEEIVLLCQSVRLNEEVFQKIFASLSGGESEIDIAFMIKSEMCKQGAERESFETIVASGAASSLPHAQPSRSIVEKNGPIVIDMGLVLNGYCSDMTRTFCLEKASKQYLKIHRIVRKAQLAGIAAVRAGVTGKQVDNAARKVIAAEGYGKYFGHSLGHGVGLAVHEGPRVSTKNRKKLRSGMVITIEPGIYIPGWGGIRLENMVVVRDDGCENLNSDTTWLDI